jgi:uncharacterized protein (DUF2249 family)
MAQWWAYKHKNGEIKVKHYRSEDDMDEALDSDFVDDVTGPFDAETVEEANEIAKKNLAASKTKVFRQIRAMIRKGKTDKEIADKLKAEDFRILTPEERKKLVNEITDAATAAMSAVVDKFEEENKKQFNWEEATEISEVWKEAIGEIEAFYQV